MAKLALNGAAAVRTKPYPRWPGGGVEEKQWLDKVLNSNRWFAGLQGDDPEALGTLFGKRFADLHGARHALPNGPIFYDSFHCSRYNTNTGRLTTAMFEDVFAAIRGRLDRR